MRCVFVDRKGRRCVRSDAHVLHSFTQLRARGRKVRREQGDLDRARDAVRARSDGWCEAHELLDDNGLRARYCGTILLHAGVHAHHLAPSDRDRGVHDPGRMLWLCSASHAHLHREPSEAYRLGLMLRDGAA